MHVWYKYNHNNSYLHTYANENYSICMIYKYINFDFEIVNFPILEGDVPRSTFYGVYNSQLIRFARASSYISDFKTLK